MISKTFCAIPWVHLAINTRGTFRLCCNQSYLSEDVKKGGYLESHYSDKETVEDMWNSDTYKDVRLKMLKGEKLGPCSKCYREEELGMRSARLIHTDEYFPGMDEIDPHGECSVDSIKYVDVRLGNRCNLKCRMCNAYSSDQWIGDERLTHARGISEEDLQQLEEMDWFEKDFFWDNLLSAMDNCEVLYFSGGEPTLFAEKQFNLFDKCIEKGIAKNILLRYNTNLTIPFNKFEKYWLQFRHMRINCSIDGVGKVNDYIRYPSTWRVVEKNFLSVYNKTQEKDSRVSMNVMTTVQMCNIFDLVNLFNYLKPFKLFPLLNILNQPGHYNIRVLNQEQKDKVGNEIMTWYEDNREWLIKHDRHLKTYEKLPKVVDYMHKEDWSHLYPDFAKETETLDKMRNQRVEDYVPELTDE